MPFSVLTVVALSFIGLIAGLIGGMLGVGGSIIMIPGMVLVVPGGTQHVFQAAAMIVNVFVAGPAAVQHWRAGAVLKPIIRPLVAGAAAGVSAGVEFSNHPIFQGGNAHRLAKIFAVFLAYVAVYNIYRLIRGNRMAKMSDDDCRNLSVARVLTVGAGMGLAAGLTGVGGGALAVPMQQVFLRMPLRNAIANSACTIVFSALVGAIHKNFTLVSRLHMSLSHSLIIAATLIPTGFIGGWIGAKLTHRLPREPVRITFIALLLFGVWRMWTAKPVVDPPANAPAVVVPADSQPAAVSVHHGS